MKKYLANLVTGIRIICSIWMLFVPVFSPVFYGAYLLGGFTDMIDGSIARKMKTETDFGSVLDSIADLVFVTVALFKILPAINLPIWLWGAIFMIAVVKIINLVWGYFQKKRLVFMHTVMNKITGFLLFLLPLTLSCLDLKYSANVLCVIAFFSAVQEGYLMRRETKAVL